MLALSWSDLLLAWVTNERRLDVGVNHKHWGQVMNMLSLLSLSEDIDLRANGSLSDLWQLGLDVECEATELLDVHGSSGSDVLVDVFDEGLPDDHVLGLWLKWLEAWGASLGGVVVLSWVLSSILENPANTNVSCRNQ